MAGIAHSWAALFLVVLWGEAPGEGFFSTLRSLMHCNIVLCFWACASLLQRVALGMTEHKATRSLVYFTAQTRYQSGRECGPAQHQRCHGYMKRFSLTGTDPLPTIHWLLNKSAPQRFQVFYYSGETRFHFKWIQGNKIESQRRHRYARLRKRNLSRSQNFIK